MHLSGHNVKNLVESNIYSGLEATLQFNKWKKGMTGTENLSVKINGKTEPLDSNNSTGGRSMYDLAVWEPMNDRDAIRNSFYDGINKAEIQEILTACKRFDDSDHPNYQFAVSNACFYSLHASNCMVVCMKHLR